MLWTPGDSAPVNWGEPREPARGVGRPVDDGGSCTDVEMPSDLRERELSPIPRPYYYDKKIT